MKILIYGSNGWIGNQFVNILSKASENSWVAGKARVDDIDALENEISSINPTHIVSFIGRTHGKIGNQVYSTIDYLEQEGKLIENIRDNLFAPIVLANICCAKNIHFTYLGTGCIFKYDDNHPFGQEIDGFTEDDDPNFFGSSYSIVKGFTDRLMRMYKNNVLNLRIRMPITGEYNSRNFITKITNYKKICSVPNSMSVLPELLEHVVDMMKNGLVGTINLTNPGLISHNEILEMYKQIVDPNFTWENFSQAEQRQILAADRSNNYLDTTSLSTLYPQVSNIKNAVKKCLESYIVSTIVPTSVSSTVPVPVGGGLLVTGGCGFIGSNFINQYFEKFIKNNGMLVNIDAMYYCANENNVHISIQNHPNYKLYKGNISDTILINKILTTHNITQVLHFAAQSHVQNSFDDSIQFTKDNVMGTHNLLECCRLYGKIARFIHVSTDEVYGESMIDINESKKTEHSLLCPTNPYAATKAGAELIAQSYYHSYKFPIIITRGNNVYGPNQYAEKLVPRFIKLLSENKKVTIQGDGSALRGFLHVNDTVSAFIKILENGVIGDIYNIGCDDDMEISVFEVAKILIKLIKNTENYDEWIEYIKDRPFQDTRYYINNDKLKALGWEIEIKFSNGIQELCNEIKKNQ